MIVMSWNIQKNSNKNIKIDQICATIIAAGIDRNGWILAILENVGDGEEIGDALKLKLRGAWYKVVSAGGIGGTVENVILVGGRCELIDGGINQDWKKAFNKFYTDGHQKLLDNYSARRADNDGSSSSSESGKIRQSTIVNTANSINNADIWDADKCRNPVVAIVQPRGEKPAQLTIGFVHSPGPQAHTVGIAGGRKIPYALTYFDCIMQSLSDAGIEVVIGDFNIYGDTKTADFKQNHDITTGTTFSRTEAVGKSRLDRAFLTPKYSGVSGVKILDGGRGVSDHVGLHLTLETTTGVWQQSGSAAAGAAAASPSSASAAAAGSSSASAAAAGSSSASAAAASPSPASAAAASPSRASAAAASRAKRIIKQLGAPPPVYASVPQKLKRKRSEQDDPEKD